MFLVIVCGINLRDNIFWVQWQHEILTRDPPCWMQLPPPPATFFCCCLQLKAPNLILLSPLWLSIRGRQPSFEGLNENIQLRRIIIHDFCACPVKQKLAKRLGRPFFDERQIACTSSASPFLGLSLSFCLKCFIDAKRRSPVETVNVISATKITLKTRGDERLTFTFHRD